LLVATLAGWRLDPTAVDLVIAGSVVYVGVQGLVGRPRDARVTAAVVFGFGLVHGLGLSTRLQDLGLPEDGLVARILVFNVRVGLGQLAALAVMVATGSLVARAVREKGRARPVAYGALVAAGMVAVGVVAASTGSADAPATAIAGCRETPYTPVVVLGEHPRKDFYGPDEEAPGADLSHVLGDGYVIVTYKPTIPEPDVEAL